MLYVRGGTLLAVPFDLDRLEVSGQEVPLVDGLVSSTLSGAAQFAVSDDGTLAYVVGPGFANSRLISWLRPNGETAALHAMSSV